MRHRLACPRRILRPRAFRRNFAPELLRTRVVSQRRVRHHHRMVRGGVGLSERYATETPHTPDMRIALLAAQQNAVVSTRQLAACGLTSPAITRRTRRGTLHRVYRGAYSIVSADALSLQGRLTAAVLACGGGAILSHWAAAAWWELVTFDGRDPEVTVPGDGGRKIDGIRAHRRRGLDRRDVWTRASIRVTSPARTALDIAADITHQALRRMLRQAQARRAPGRQPAPRRPHPRQRPPRGTGPPRRHRRRAHADAKRRRGPVARPHPPGRAAASRGQPAATARRHHADARHALREHKLVIEIDGAQYHAGRPERTTPASRPSSRPRATACYASPTRS